MPQSETFAQSDIEGSNPDVGSEGSNDRHSVTAQLPNWANTQESWIRHVVRDVLKSGARCADGDIDRYLKVFLAEKGLSEEPFTPADLLEERDLDETPLEALKLESLTITGGVNAIKNGARLDFAPGVTVVFGENGSGKSGFVRVIKRAAGVRSAEEILHNVRGSERPAPSADFHVAIGAATAHVIWKNEFGLDPLNRIHVFDARGALLHVEENLSYVYTPGELAYFPLVQDAIERVRAAIEVLIGSRTTALGPNNLLALFDPACSLYETIKSLGPSTDLESIRDYAVLPEGADATIESLNTEIQSLGSSNPENDLKRTRDRLAVVQSLKTAIDCVANFDTAAYELKLKARSDAFQRKDQAGDKAFNDLGIPGVLTDEWRDFIVAGEAYLKAHMPDGYPNSPDPCACAYCRQALPASAVALVKKYRDFTSDQFQRACDKAASELEELVAPVLAIRADDLHSSFCKEVTGIRDTLKPLAATIDRIKAMAESVKDGTSVAWPDKQGSTAKAGQIVEKGLGSLTALVADLGKSASQRQGLLKQRQAELIELRGKKIAGEQFSRIEERVLQAKWIARATVLKNVTNVLRSLTDAAKEASKELLDNDFERRFKAECLALRAPKVTLEFPGRQGQVTRRKLVANHRPGQVLSEGEQKALALADFVAEVTAAPIASPIVFDDPITSMDYRRIHEVSDRIVALAAEHQVIVFTHNIWFAAELLAKANKKDLRYYDIRSEEGNAGVVTAASHPRVDTVAKLCDRVRNLIASAEKIEGEARAALVEKGYEHLRALCEVTVEQELLKGVVQRYEPNVMMTKLERINVSTLQASIAVVFAIFEKACRYIASHSQPLETQGIRPTLHELKDDFKKVLAARDPHKG